MSTTTDAMTSTPSKTRNLVDMNWDPINRIVGSLVISTKIDFENREVAECHSTSSIFRGYSVFMKGKDPRDAHFITSRICGICVAFLREYDKVARHFLPRFARNHSRFRLSRAACGHTSEQYTWVERDLLNYGERQSLHWQ